MPTITETWKHRHNIESMQNSQGGNLYRLAVSLKLYLEAMERETGYRGAEDYYCAPYLEDIANGIIGLLSANIGNLDGGTMDKMVRDTMKAAGFTSFE